MKPKEIELTYMGVKFTLEDLKKYLKNSKDCELHKSGGLMYFRIKLNEFSDVNYNEFDEMAQNIFNLDSIKIMAVWYTIKKLKNNIPEIFNQIILSEDEDEAFDLLRDFVLKKY